MHNHAFLILAALLSSALSVVEGLAAPILSAFAGLISTLIGFWIVIYLFLSLKNFFEQGYAITLVKFLTMVILYAIVTAVGIAAFAAVLFFLF